jgi:hypothetical protein
MAKISAMVKHANKPFNAAQLGNFLPFVQIVSRGSQAYYHRASLLKCSRKVSSVYLPMFESIY